jgi:hypothetical protein
MKKFEKEEKYEIAKDFPDGSPSTKANLKALTENLTTFHPLSWRWSNLKYVKKKKTCGENLSAFSSWPILSETNFFFQASADQDFLERDVHDQGPRKRSRKSETGARRFPKLVKNLRRTPGSERGSRPRVRVDAKKIVPGCGSPYPKNYRYHFPTTLSLSRSPTSRSTSLSGSSPSPAFQSSEG